MADLDGCIWGLCHSLDVPSGSLRWLCPQNAMRAAASIAKLLGSEQSSTDARMMRIMMVTGGYGGRLAEAGVRTAIPSRT